MAHEIYSLTVKAETDASAGSGAAALADLLSEVDGVLEAVRTKTNHGTMDLGSFVSVVAGSGATLAIAQGIAAWLRMRRAVTVTVEQDRKCGSLKAAVFGLDPEAAVRIIEIIRNS